MASDWPHVHVIILQICVWLSIIVEVLYTVYMQHEIKVALPYYNFMALHYM